MKCKLRSWLARQVATGSLQPHEGHSASAELEIIADHSGSGYTGHPPDPGLCGPFRVRIVPNAHKTQAGPWDVGRLSVLSALQKIQKV